MSQEQASINGALLRLRREARGWLQTDVATRACMSVKQIRQLEDGGLSAFYSEAVKATAAKKVGALLGLTEDEVFSQGQPELHITHSSLSPDAALAELLSTTHELPPHEEPPPFVVAAELAHQDHADASDDGVHHDSPVSVEPAEVLEPVVHAAAASSATVQETASMAPSTAHTSSATPLHHETPASAGKSKTSLGLIVVLFVGAIVVAALFRPEAEPVATEAPPPLQPALQSEPAPEGSKDAAAQPDATQGAGAVQAPGATAPANAPSAGASAAAPASSNASAVAPSAPAASSGANTPAANTPATNPQVANPAASAASGGNAPAASQPAAAKTN